jgi:hypothetical protein
MRCNSLKKNTQPIPIKSDKDRKADYVKKHKALGEHPITIWVTDEVHAKIKRKQKELSACDLHDPESNEAKETVSLGNALEDLLRKGTADERAAGDILDVLQSTMEDAIAEARNCGVSLQYQIRSELKRAGIDDPRLVNAIIHAAIDFMVELGDKISHDFSGRIS